MVAEALGSRKGARCLPRSDDIGQDLSMSDKVRQSSMKSRINRFLGKLGQEVRRAKFREACVICMKLRCMMFVRKFEIKEKRKEG